MGLFDFVRTIGRKVFDRDADANDKIKKEIEASLKGVDGLTVDYDAASGVVKLGGTASSPEAMEKAVLIAGNTLGVANVNVDAMKHPGESAGVEYYIIKSGDTLSKVAKKFGITLDALLAANKDTIKDPDKVSIGDPVTIPAPAPNYFTDASPTPSG